jgi:hypothetical protein
MGVGFDLENIVVLLLYLHFFADFNQWYFDFTLYLLILSCEGVNLKAVTQSTNKPMNPDKPLGIACGGEWTTDLFCLK